MEFGYFTLSDNHYPDNPRTANQFVLEIREQAILADRIGMHSAWIGEHHFDSLGVNSRPDLVLANVAAQTKHIRLAPAVNVLPLHHPVHVAECWATLDVLSGGRVDFATGRGYDRKEYAPFGADFMASAEIFEEGIDVLLKAWNSPGKWSHRGRFYDIPQMAITPTPVQKPLPFYVASFSKTSVDIAAKRGLNIIYAPFAAGMVFGGLDKAVETYREACVKAGKKPGRAMCSYFIYIADDARQEDYGRQTQMDYFNHCVLQAFPQKKEDAPPTMQYFMKIVEILKNLKKEDLSDKSILLGSPQKIVDTLKKVEKAGVEEVILYFNVGRKPHNLVKEQMHRFMQEIAPQFQGKHLERGGITASVAA
ncbi:MAG: LLM class flavin-dependent oxidoreductase [Betaproteobacteria bacterium]|nr:MAG: LLM class flavin-dependent oxidoreductase [Betaproteobacteria bacterium]